jgi:signal peptidase I
VTKASLKFLLSVLVVCGAIGGVLRAFFVTPVMISDDGMAPTLLAGETVLMWNNEGGTPEFGDLLVCRHPTGAGYVVGRFIARPGATISSERGSLKVDGHAADRDVDRTISFTMHGQSEAYSVIIGRESRGGEEHPFMQDARVGFRTRNLVVRDGIFLMGDNRLPHRFDSRTFGPVNPVNCVGHVFMRWATAGHRLEFDHNVLDLIN